MSIGSTPSSTKIWRRIRTLNIEMAAWPCNPDVASDHLKVLHNYIQSLPALSTLDFCWLGDTKGPSPLALDIEPCITHPILPKLDKCLPTKARSPPSMKHSLRPLRLKKLRSTRIRNAALDAAQAGDFPMRHRRHLREFDYSDCTLRSGTWDEALEPLVNRCRGSRRKLHVPAKTEEVMDVPIMFSGSEEDIGGTSNGSRGDESECVREHLWEDPERRGSLWPQALRTTKVGLKKLLRHSSKIGLGWRGSGSG
jgi:hypothetical protein